MAPGVIGSAGRSDRRLIAVSFIALVSTAAVIMSLVPAVVALAGAAALGIAGLAWPAVGFGAVAILSPIVALAQGSLGLQALVAFMGIAFAGGLFRARPGVDARTPLLLTLMLGYFAASWISASLVDGRAPDLIAVSTIGIHLGLAFLLSWSVPMNRRLVQRVVEVFAWSAAIAGIVTLGIYALADRLSISALTLAPERRNVTGMVFVVAFAIHASWLATSRSRPVKMARLGALVILALAVAVSFSRSSYVGLAAVMAVVVFRQGGRSLASTFAFIALAGGLAALSSDASLLEPVSARLSSTVDIHGGLDVSSAVRLDLWSASLAMAADQPLFGVGFLRFDDALPSYWLGSVSQVPVFGTAAQFQYSHNIVLTVLSQGGLIGGSLLLATVASLIRDARRAPAPFRGQALSVLAGTGAACMFGEPILSPLAAVPFILVNGAARAVDVPR